MIIKLFTVVKRFLLLILILFSINSCETNKGELEIIKIMPEISIDNFNDTIFFSQFGQILYKDNKFLLLNSDNRDLFICNNNFELISLLSKRGRGPGEYFYSTDINIDNNGNYVISDWHSTFRVYDSHTNFVKNIELPFESQSGRFVIENNNLITCGLDTYHPIVKFDSYGDTIKSFGIKYDYPGGVFFTKQCQLRHLFKTEDNNILAVGKFIPSIELYTSEGDLIFNETIQFLNIQANFESNYLRTKDSPNLISNLYSDVYYYDHKIYLTYWERLDPNARVIIDKIVVYKITSKGIMFDKVYQVMSEEDQPTFITCICIYSKNKLIAFNHLLSQFQFYDLDAYD